MLTLLAATPIIIVLVLMLGAGWSAVRAGWVAAAAALILAVLSFDYGSVPEFTTAEGILGVLAEAGWVALDVVAIILPALAIHQLQQRTGASSRLRDGLAQITGDPRTGALLITWFFSLFMEGAAGFGTSVALAAPFLVAAGFKPLQAVAAALVGHTAGVAFGAVGTPILAQSGITTDYTPLELAGAAAPYLVAVSFVLGVAVALIIGKTYPDMPTPWVWGLIAAGTFAVPFWLIAEFVGPELPSLVGALVGAVIFIAALKWKQRRRGDAKRPAIAAKPGELSIARAASPYLVLVGLVLITRLVPPIHDALKGVKVEWTLYDTFTRGIEPLYHPGLLLLLSFVVGGLIQLTTGAVLRDAFAAAARQVGTVLLALVAMVTVAFAMKHAGMTTQLAVAAAGVGAAWPLLAPAVGMLGTFITGSATASNLLFSEFQESTATQAGLPVVPLLGAQSAGAAVGSIVCPHNVVAASATVGLSGQEGKVLRQTLPLALLATALVGVLALVAAN